MRCKKCGHDEMTAVKEPTHGLNFRVKSWWCPSCKYRRSAYTKEDLDMWEKDFSKEIRKDKEEKKTEYVFRTLIDTDEPAHYGENKCICDGECGDSCKCKSPSTSKGSKDGCGGCGGCGGH